MDSYQLIDESLYSIWETGEPIVYPKHKPFKHYLRHEPVVYFLEATDGMIKIGYTTSLSRRIAELEIEHGPLKVLGWICGDEKREAELHTRFKNWRLGKAEWFLPNPELDQFIAHGN
jgi:hypothetical protein